MEINLRKTNHAIFYHQIAAEEATDTILLKNVCTVLNMNAIFRLCVVYILKFETTSLFKR